MKKILQKLFNTKEKFNFVSIEQSLMEDLDELDRTNPDWDLQSRVSCVIRLTKEGSMSPEMIQAMYGSRVVEMAKHKMLEQKHNE